MLTVTILFQLGKLLLEQLVELLALPPEIADAAAWWLTE